MYLTVDNAYLNLQYNELTCFYAVFKGYYAFICLLVSFTFIVTLCFFSHAVKGTSYRCSPSFFVVAVMTSLVLSIVT